MTSPELSLSDFDKAETQYSKVASVTTAGPPSRSLLLSHKYLCLDYETTDLDVFVKWLKDIDRVRLELNLMLPKVVLLANFDKLAAGEAERCNEKLWPTYATFADYPDGATSYEEAVKLFDAMLVERRKMPSLAAA